MFEPWQMREMRPCPRQIREICSCARAAAGLEGAAGAGRGPAQNTLQTTQSQWLRPASIAGQSVHERARSAPRKNWGICAFPRNFRPVGANARNLAARANPRNLGAVSPPYYPPRALSHLVPRKAGARSHASGVTLTVTMLSSHTVLCSGGLSDCGPWHLGTQITQWTAH